LLHKSDGKELTPKDAKTKAEEAEAKKDVFYLLLAVLGTLLFISALMVRLSNPFLDSQLTLWRSEQRGWQEHDLTWRSAS
jgi:hypothetical protein